MSKLYEIIPFLNNLGKKRREYLERYFENAPIWVLDSIQTVILKKDTILIKENTPVDMVYLVGEGIIKAVEYRFFGFVYEFCSFHEPQAFGAMEILMEERLYRTTLQAVSECMVIKIPRNIYERWLNIDTQVLRMETKNSITSLLEQGRKSRAFLFLQGGDRLAYILTDLYLLEQKNEVLYVGHSRQELADISGLSIKTINRAVKKFEENHWITRQGSHFSVDREQYQLLDGVVSGLLER